MGWVFNATPRPLCPRERDPVLTVTRLGGPQGWSGRVRKISFSPGFDPPHCRVRSKSLYLLSYSGPPERPWECIPLRHWSFKVQNADWCSTFTLNSAHIRVVHLYTVAVSEEWLHKIIYTICVSEWFWSLFMNSPWKWSWNIRKLYRPSSWICKCDRPFFFIFFTASVSLFSPHPQSHVVCISKGLIDLAYGPELATQND